MTIVQVITQQVERVDNLKCELKTKEHLIKKAEVHDKRSAEKGKSKS